MTRRIPGSKRPGAHQPSEDERDRFFSRLTEPWSPYTFDVPDPHPAMDRPGWRVFRPGGGQSRRDWIVGIVFLVIVVGLAALVIVRDENERAASAGTANEIEGPGFALQELVDRTFQQAEWYPHLLRVYDEDAAGEVEVRTDLVPGAAGSGLVERMCGDIASVANARVVVTSQIADEIWRCTA